VHSWNIEDLLGKNEENEIVIRIQIWTKT